MQPSGDFRILQATPADTPLIARVRLAALRDTPGAFLSRYEDYVGYSEDDWRALFSRWTQPPDNAVFVATHGEDEGIGMCGGFVLSPERVMLVAMWVVAEWRGSRVARQLVEHVFDFARGRGAAEVAAWVVDDNHRAMRFYRNLGFDPDGARQAFAPDPEKDELLVVRRL